MSTIYRHHCQSRGFFALILVLGNKMRHDTGSKYMKTLLTKPLKIRNGILLCSKNMITDLLTLNK